MAAGDKGEINALFRLAGEQRGKISPFLKAIFTGRQFAKVYPYTRTAYVNQSS